MRSVPIILSALIFGGTAGAAPASPTAVMAQHIPAPGGEVILTSKFDQDTYRDYHLSAMRRAGDFLFFSGAVVGSPTPVGPEEFGRKLQKLFALLQAKLAEAHASAADVVSVHSYHAFRSTRFTGTKEQHLATFEGAMHHFFQAPYPTWTALGVDQLYDDNGLVEVELMAYVPQHPAAN